MAKLNDSCFWPPYWCPSEGFQHAISPLSSKKLVEIFFKYLAYEKLHWPEFWWCIAYLSSFILQILDFDFNFHWCNSDNQQCVLGVTIKYWKIQTKEINLEKMKNYHLSKHSCNPFVTFSHFVNLFLHLIGNQFVGGDMLPY